MMIKVRIFGVVRLKAGISGFETNVQTLDELLGMIPGVSRREAKDLVVLVNGQSVKKSYHFQDGDEVSFLAPAGGG